MIGRGVSIPLCLLIGGALFLIVRDRIGPEATIGLAFILGALTLIELVDSIRRERQAGSTLDE